MNSEEREKFNEYHANYQRQRVAKLSARLRETGELPPGVEHGTSNAYSNHGCRCGVCVAGQRERQIPAVSLRRSKGLSADDPRHGSYNGYCNYGCRCVHCVEANRVFNIRVRLKKGNISVTRAEELISKGRV